MKNSLRILVAGLLASAASALAVILCAGLVFEQWIGDKEPVYGYAFAMVVAAGVFCVGFIVTIVFAVSKMGEYDARRRGRVITSDESDTHDEAENKP